MEALTDKVAIDIVWSSTHQASADLFYNIHDIEMDDKCKVLIVCVHKYQQNIWCKRFCIQIRGKNKERDMAISSQSQVKLIPHLKSEGKMPKAHIQSLLHNSSYPHCNISVDKDFGINFYSLFINTIELRTIIATCTCHECTKEMQSTN